MLVEVPAKEYRQYFPLDPHHFVSESFIELNRHKADRIIRLIDKSEKTSLGLVAGIIKNTIKSPFSSSFGGFHFRNSNHHAEKIDNFLKLLINYVNLNELDGVEITLPPDIYQQNMNAKLVNAMHRVGFKMETPDITNWADLSRFNGLFSHRKSRNYYNQAKRNGLTCTQVETPIEFEAVYRLIKENRKRFGRPIYMTLNDILETGNFWPVDFFTVKEPRDRLCAAAIFYRAHPDISYAVFWGDNEEGRPLRAMDYLSFCLMEHYKRLGYKYIDFGTSTESGTPNNGLLRFKETHECASSLRFKFIYQGLKRK
jgi:hypothetical protein